MISLDRFRHDVKNLVELASSPATMLRAGPAAAEALASLENTLENICHRLATLEAEKARQADWGEGAADETKIGGTDD